ncbi:hypothetical protein SVAN01_05030 [Stagonosporopsis vannaccii]|nr:hypothetical protein SVAN01_05030 [Stagonosporopsis vannaccii]
MSATLPDIYQSPPGTQTTPGLDELKSASLKFLACVQARFGENSSQLHNIHETLSIFRKGQLSKRDAHTTILGTLGEHNDLRQQLMEILMHPVAEWAPGDFDLPTEQPMQSLVKSAPQYLQPPHQPQMRLPSISSNWFPMPQAEHSPGHLSFAGYDDYNPIVSSPPLNLAPIQLPHPSSNLWTDHSSEMIYPAANNNSQIPPLVHMTFRNPWQDMHYTDTWTNEAMSFLPDSAYVSEHNELHGSLAACCRGHTQLPKTCSHDPESHENEGSLLQENVLLMPASQTSSHLPPSSVNGIAFQKSDLQGHWPSNSQTPSTTMSQSPPEVDQVQHDEGPNGDTFTERNGSTIGIYIHALCGKGFATLSGVKKHHWGKKVHDLATTTGCWAKHKKPDVAWDGHPSCKGLQQSSEISKSFSFTSKQGQANASSPQAKALAASDPPQFNTVPGFPTLAGLPKTVAKTLSTGNASTSDSEEWESRYHSQRLPSRSSFDSLLTAVNMISQIDVPRPEVRTSSNALHLDAQVAAAEQHAHFLPYIPSARTFDRRSVRPHAPIAPDTMIPAPGLGSSRRLPTAVEGNSASTSLLRLLEPLDSPPSGPVKKKRRV